MMQPVPYTNLRMAESRTQMIAQMRRKRLNKAPNAWCAAITMDLLLGAGPWLAGVCAVAVGLWRLHDTVDGVPEAFAHFNSAVAISAISTFSAFLLVSRIQNNLGSNKNIIDQFGNLTGSLINLSLWVKSQMVSTKTAAALMPFPDGSGGTYMANKIGLTLASVPYIVKYVGRGVNIMPEGLPIGQDKQLVDRYNEFTSSSMFGSSGGLSPFAAMVLMVSEQIDQVQKGEKASEYAVLFAQLNAVTGAEGAIGGVSTYVAPYIMTALLYALVVLYLLLALISDLIPNNGGNSIWIAAVMAFCTIVFFQISARYANPMALRSKQSGQAPLISQMCVSTEKAILAVFSRTNPYMATKGLEPVEEAPMASAGFQMRFS
jgi:hypothetical protein